MYDRMQGWLPDMSDGWMSGSRDSQGNLQVDAKRFPRGVKYLADLVSCTIKDPFSPSTKNDFTCLL